MDGNSTITVGIEDLGFLQKYKMYRLLFLLAIATAVQVKGRPGYLSYSDFRGKPYTVTYDKRSFLLNGERSLFLGGSIHYPRATPGKIKCARIEV